jgi:hypothetical protein
MINPHDILRTARDLESPVLEKLLWWVHSHYAENDGFEKLATSFLSFMEANQRKIKLGADDHRVVESGYLVRAFTHFCNGYELPSWVNLLMDFHADCNAKARQRFHLTNVGRQVWETLDWCLEERRPCFVEGREGRGKTSAARAWHEAHRGDSRYVSLPGLRTQRDFFEAIATAYGVNFSAAKAPNEIRFRVRDMIVRSGLILILDEAHHALPERHRAGRPPLIDWIDCDLCNAGVPVALVSTPQFGPLLSEFEDRTKWNAGQFRRRFSGRWTCLPEKTTETDLAALAESALPQVGSRGIKLAVGYAGTFGRDVSGLFDLVHDAERRARRAGHSQVTFQDLRDAFELDRVPSENAMANAFKRPVYSRPGESSGEEITLPEAGEPIAAPLQRSRRAPESEFAAPDRGTSAPLLATH